MKKNKIATIIVFLIVLFIIFVFGLFIGKKLSPKSSKEGTIKESALKNKNNLPAEQNKGEQSPVSADNIKFAPISKLDTAQKEKVAETEKSTQVQKPQNKPAAKPKVETKIIYVKKPVYIYKYVTRKYPVKKGKTSSSNSLVYYTIQVAALKHYARAKTLAGKLNSMGFFAYIVPISVSGKTGKKVVYQQVRVGKFSSASGAKSIKDAIANKFKVKPYIVKVVD